MAKRGKKPQAPTKRTAKGTVEYLRPVMQFDDGGIYRYARIVGYESVPLTQAEFDRLSRPPDIAVELAGAMRAARNVAAEKIRPHLTPIDRIEKAMEDVPYTEADRCQVWQETARYELCADGTALHSGGYHDVTALVIESQLVTIVDVGDGPRWYALNENPLPDDVAVALAALRALERMKVDIEGGMHDAECREMAFHAFRLGRLLERLNAMKHEPNALTGKQSRKQGKSAGEARLQQLAEQMAWALREYENTLTVDPKDTRGARQRVRERFPAKFPNAKLPADSTIEEWVREAKKNADKSLQSQSQGRG